MLTSLKVLYALKPKRQVDLYMHISLKNHYVFMHNSKVASSTIKYYLQELEYVGTRYKISNVNNKQLSPHISPFQLEEKQLLEVLNSDEYIKICFVRDPYSRLLSCYLDRIAGKNNQITPSKRQLLKLLNNDDNYLPRFEEFIKVICKQDSFDMDPHWRIQKDDLLCDFIDYDFFGKFESLQKDIIRMFETIKSKDKIDIDFKVNKSPSITSAKEKVEKFYTTELKKIVYEKYKADFDLFKYTK